jgi:hypothetical protein
MEPLRLRGTATEGLRLNPECCTTQWLPAVQAEAEVESRRAR